MTLYEQVKKLFEGNGTDDVLSCIEAVIRDELNLEDVSNCIKDAREQLEVLEMRDDDE